MVVAFMRNMMPSKVHHRSIRIVVPDSVKNVLKMTVAWLASGNVSQSAQLDLVKAQDERDAAFAEVETQKEVGQRVVST